MKRRTLVLWKRLLFRLFVTSVLFSLLYVYFFTGLLTIKNYKIVGVPEGYEEELKTNIAYTSERKLFFFLPANRVISYHDSEIRSTIKDLLPNTKTISVYPSGLHEITIKLTQYAPLFSINDTYAIAANGTIYKEIIPLASFTRLEIASSTTVSSDDLSYFGELSKRIGTILFPVKTISVNENNDISFFDEHKKSAVITASDIPVDTVWSTIVSAIDTEPLKSKLKSDLSNLMYIDARFGNKVFYKFTNDSGPAILPPHEATSTATTTTTVR